MAHSQRIQAARFPNRAPDPAWASLEEERRDLIDALLDSLETSLRSPEKTEVCLSLLEHTARCCWPCAVAPSKMHSLAAVASWGS